MNLAERFLVSIFCIVPALSLLAARPGDTPTSWNNSIQAEGTQGQGTTPPAQSPSNTAQPPSGVAASPSSGQNSHSPKKRRRRHKKKVRASNCSAPASSGQSSLSPSAANSSTGTGTDGATNCPPAKVIVRQGGTAEPAIQLAGGAASASPQKDTGNQMLVTTEANLKKIAGRQLSSDQQNMVNQIHQFMEQSKAAVGDGDLDRARTLAWKAQVLSEELVKPAK